MNRVTTAAIVAGLLLAMIGPEATARQTRTLANAKPIGISYVEPKSPEYKPLYNLLKERQALEKIRELLRPLRLPHRLLLRTSDCDGIANAWSDGESVTLCYELLDEIWKNAPETVTPAGVTPVDAVIGPFVDVFLHEAGHAVFRALRIPLFGREEDAADQFSAYIMLRLDKDEARRLVLGSAYQYKHELTSPSVTVERRKFADEHGTPAQRFYNLLCLAYGADPIVFRDVVEKGFLPQERADICGQEYAQVDYAFEVLIGPHVDHGLARKLHKRWLPPVSTNLKR